jgi:hypothetical protein
MKTINYKGKGEHSVNELELIIEKQTKELHLLKSGQKQLPIHVVVGQSEQLKTFLDEIANDKTYILSDYCKNKAKRLSERL